MGADLPKVIGVVHLLPLPGSPQFGGSIGAVVERGLQDCRAYHDGEVSSLIIENFGDAPFTAGKVDPVTVAAMTLATSEFKKAFPDIEYGINVLRNDAESALSIATVVGASFIRVNVYVGAVVADQGIIEGDAYRITRLGKSLSSSVKVFADVGGKHAAKIGEDSLKQQAADALERGLADAVIITGRRTGEAVDFTELRGLRQDFAQAKIIVGSGANSGNVGELLKYANGVIVGTSVKVNGITTNPVDPLRLKEFVKAVAPSPA